jgi:glycosyltransferase involved in cell wall biosynthesis
MEAISAEVALLRREFPSSIAWGLNHRNWVLLSWRRGYSVHPRLHLLFRVATRLFESAFDIHHVFGSLGDWFYLHRVRRQPTVLTVAAGGPPVERHLLQQVDQFVVEYPQAREELDRLGIPSGRVRLVFPPVDLEKFAPAPPPDGPFTVLFASSPEEPDWLEARGVPYILDAAALRPEMQFRLLWRPWGTSEGVVRRWIAERGLRNVELSVGRWNDMAAQYNAAHACMAPFTDTARAKPAPNSIVESLACGRPVLVTEQVGLADLVREGGAGFICPAAGAALADRLDALQRDWDFHAASARRLAKRWFGVDRFLSEYHRLYEQLLPGSKGTG